MKSLKNFLILFFLILITASCAHTPAPILPLDIRTINISIFSNKTLIYGLENKLTDKIIEKFILDGHLNVISNKKTDTILSGEIISYHKEPLSYDREGYITKYKLWILINVFLTDKDNKEIWKEKFEGSIIYIPSTSSLYSPSHIEYETEEDAREALFENLAWDIVNRTIEGW
ncbi:hypothetical protein KKB54_01950 [bacterium]|nr:hypothetical protein [bacterium]MBU0899566.1 hypothetical protein [bacterium]MBU1153124.1 hypothetical protein [bacterium]MBU1781925.1 hypothetical protein [bacterium]MBU2599213.1 hypothetical protein [bacterium]